MMMMMMMMILLISIFSTISLRSSSLPLALLKSPLSSSISSPSLSSSSSSISSPSPSSSSSSSISLSSSSSSFIYNSEWGDLELVTISSNPLLFWYIYDELDDNDNDNDNDKNDLFLSYKNNNLYGLKLKHNNNFFNNTTLNHDDYFCNNSHFLIPMYCIINNNNDNEINMLWVKSNIRRQGHATKIMSLLKIKKVNKRMIDLSLSSRSFFDSCNVEYNYNDYNNNNNNSNNNSNNNDNDKNLMLTAINSNDMTSLYGELKATSFVVYRTNFLNAYYDSCLFGLRSYSNNVNNNDNIDICNNSINLVPIFMATYDDHICGLIWTAVRARRKGLGAELCRLLEITSVDTPMSNDDAIHFWSKMNLNVQGIPEDGYDQKMQILNDKKNI